MMAAAAGGRGSSGCLRHTGAIGRLAGVAGWALVALVSSCGGGDSGGPGGTDPPPGSSFQIQAGGNNVPDRFSSDLWVHGSWAYTGTWGGAPRNGVRGDVVKIWSLDPAGAPTLVDSLKIPGISTVSDVQVTADGALLVFSAERGANAGLYVYDLSNPRVPVLLDSALVADGLHTATVAEIAGHRYVFAARNPKTPALVIYDISEPTAIAVSATVPIPPAYGIHDTFVREGWRSSLPGTRASSSTTSATGSRAGRRPGRRR